MQLTKAFVCTGLNHPPIKMLLILLHNTYVYAKDQIPVESAEHFAGAPYPTTYVHSCGLIHEKLQRLSTKLDFQE